MIKIQYAVLPKKNYLKHGFSSLFPPQKRGGLAEHQDEEDPCAPVAEPGPAKDAGFGSSAEASVIAAYGDAETEDSVLQC